MSTLTQALQAETTQAAFNAALNGASRAANGVLGASPTVSAGASWLIVGAFTLFGVVLAAVLAARAGR